MSPSLSPAERYESERRRSDIEAYLIEEVRKGRLFFKAREVSEATGISIRCVGSNISRLSSTSRVLEISRWSYCTRTVWKIEEKNHEAGNTAVACRSMKAENLSDASGVRLSIEKQ